MIFPLSFLGLYQFIMCSTTFPTIHSMLVDSPGHRRRYALGNGGRTRVERGVESHVRIERAVAGSCEFGNKSAHMAVLVLRTPHIPASAGRRPRCACGAGFVARAPCTTSEQAHTRTAWCNRLGAIALMGAPPPHS
ncbi:hypothetical protein C8F04DRAFT_1096892, partial [Mycena alexandri]